MAIYTHLWQKGVRSAVEMEVRPMPIDWRVAYLDREGPLDAVDLSWFRELVDPMRARILERLGPMVDDIDVQMIFEIDEDRSLTFTMRGDTVDVNAARDRLGDKFAVGDPKN